MSSRAPCVTAGGEYTTGSAWIKAGRLISGANYSRPVGSESSERPSKRLDGVRVTVGRSLVEIFQGGIEMLVLSRRQEEVIVIGEDIEIMIVRIGPNSVRVGIKAPRELNIVRKELIDGSKTDSAETQIEAESGAKA